MRAASNVKDLVIWLHILAWFYGVGCIDGNTETIALVVVSVECSANVNSIRLVVPCHLERLDTLIARLKKPRKRSAGTLSLKAWISPRPSDCKSVENEIAVLCGGGACTWSFKVSP